MPNLPSRSDNINDAESRRRGAEQGERFNFARDDKLRPSLFGVAARFPTRHLCIRRSRRRTYRHDGGTSRRVACYCFNASALAWLTIRPSFCARSTRENFVTEMTRPRRLRCVNWEDTSQNNVRVKFNKFVFITSIIAYSYSISIKNFKVYVNMC